MRRWTVAASSGARPANSVPARSGRGATSTSPRLRSIALSDRLGDVLGRARADAGRQLDARVGEHAGIADEAGEDRRDAHAAVVQVRAQRRGEPAQAVLGWRCRSSCPATDALPASEEMNTQVAAAALRTIAGASAWARTIGARRLTVERTVDLLGGEASRGARWRAARRWPPGCPPRRPPERAAATSAATLRSAAIARPRAPRRAARAGRLRRPVSVSCAPRAASARAIACPMPPSRR